MSPIERVTQRFSHVIVMVNLVSGNADRPPLFAVVGGKFFGRDITRWTVRTGN